MRRQAIPLAEWRELEASRRQRRQDKDDLLEELLAIGLVIFLVVAGILSTWPT